MKSKYTGVFTIEKANRLKGSGGEGRLKKYTSSLFIALPPIERTFCWGDVCQRLLIQFVPPVLFLNVSADFIPGML